MVAEGKVKVSKVQGPASLTMVEVLVVCPDFYWMSHSFKEIPPLLQGLDDGQHLVVDLVILFYWGQQLAVKDHWVPLSICGQLL